MKLGEPCPPFPHFLAKSCRKNTLIEHSFTLIEQSSHSFLIVSQCSSVNLVRSVVAEFDSCGMAKVGGYDPIFGSST